MQKKVIMASVAAALTAAMSITALAAPATSQYPGWYFDNDSKRWFNKGNWAQDDIGFWYDLGDGNYLKNGKYSIDGDCDGTYEFYYFNENGYMMTDYTASDGNYFDENGHWVAYGRVWTNQLLIPDPEAEHYTDNGGYNSNGCSNVAMNMLHSSREENAKYIEVASQELNICTYVIYANGFSVAYAREGSGTHKRVAVSHTRADLDGTYLFKYYDSSLTPDQLAESLQRKGWVWGISGRYVSSSGTTCFISVSADGLIGSLQYGGGNHGSSISLQ